MKNQLTLWLTATCLLALPAAADAYVLKGPQLLQQMVEHGSTVGSLVVEQRIRIPTDSNPENPSEIPQTLRYQFPGRFRSDIETDSLRRIHLVSGDATLTVVDGVLRREGVGAFDRYKDLLLYRSRARLEKILTEAGVDVGVTSLGRSDGRVVYVIGAVYPDASLPQVWIDKELFRPLRWLQGAGKGAHGKPLDIRYRRWENRDGVWYPMQITFYREGHPVRELMVDRVVADVAFQPDVFDLAHVRKTAVQSSPRTLELAKDSTGEVEEIIEEFRKMYRK
ncbi:MAG: outer membrane lipoprotein-sorting protein [Desulfobacteraceae bacterium]|nr:outer membrane lipoprotein-sorting protein [Desulfobacteraceae bacterium]